MLSELNGSFPIIRSVLLQLISVQIVSATNVPYNRCKLDIFKLCVLNAKRQFMESLIVCHEETELSNSYWKISSSATKSLTFMR